MIQKLSKEQSLDLYKQNIRKDFIEPFPVFEEYKQAINKEIYKSYLYIEDNISKAYMILQEKESSIFIPWYAVFEEYRGQGIGTKAIEELKQTSKKDIILEVENEKNAQTQKDLEIIKKRIRFYKKLNFKKIEGIEYKLNGESYDIMILGEQKTPKQIKEKIKEKYEEVVKDQEKIQIKI